MRLRFVNRENFVLLRALRDLSCVEDLPVVQVIQVDGILDFTFVHDARSVENLFTCGVVVVVTSDAVVERLYSARQPS